MRPLADFRAVAALGAAAAIVLYSLASHAQSPSQSNVTPSRATTLPLSGTSSSTGMVSAVQQTAPDTTPTRNVITTLVTAQQPYLDLRTNLGALAQSAAVQQTKGQREVVKSTLLPRLNTVISEEFERINLRTQGMEVATFPESVQFNFYDARAVRLNQSVFDLVQLRNLHSATETLQTNIHAARIARAPGMSVEPKVWLRERPSRNNPLQWPLSPNRTRGPPSPSPTSLSTPRPSSTPTSMSYATSASSAFSASPSRSSGKA